MSKIKTYKFKWVISEAPTGQYRSFQKRGWPMAYYATGDIAITIHCGDDYSFKDAKTGTHGELKVNIAFHPKVHNPAESAFKWKTLKARFATLAEAKAAGEAFLNAHPEITPPGVEKS